MSPTAAVGFTAVTIQPLPSPTADTVEKGRAAAAATAAATPLLALQKEIELVIKEINSLLDGQEIAPYHQDEPDGEHLRALVHALTRRLTEQRDHNAEDVKMVKAHQIVARVCEYADMIVQNCFGSGCASEARKETAKNGKNGPTKPSNSTQTSALPSPAKSEEIRRASETIIQPNDQAFQDLQSALSQLAEEGESLRARLDGLVVQNEGTRAALYELESRMIHRLARARVRNIKFIVKIEEEWLMDPDSIDANKAPCSTCIGHRLADPPLPYSPPEPAMTRHSK